MLEDSSDTNEGYLVPQDLQEIRFKCWEARSKWIDIGIELKLEKGDLEALKRSNKDDVDTCFTEMLYLWLKKDPRATDLIAALKQPAVGFGHLAKKLQVLEVLRREEGNSAIVLKDSEVENLSFPHITTEIHDERTRYELKQRLRWETSVIIRKFKILRQDFFDTLENQSEHNARYTRYLKELLEKEFPEEPNNVGDIRKIIEENSNFLNYDLVEDMIKLTGTKKDKEHLERYIKELRDYVQRRIFEHTTKQGDPELRVELDSYYDKYAANEIITFQYKISAILKRKIIANNQGPTAYEVNALNNEGATNENEKQLTQVIYFLLPTLVAVIAILVAIVAILIVSPSLFGLSFTNTRLSPKDCYATGTGLEIAVVGEKANAVLHTVDGSKNGYNIQMETVVCELVSESTGNRLDVDCGVKKGSGSQYKVSYQPTSLGRHQLHIKVEGEHIKGSPFPVTVRLPLKKLGIPVKTISGMKKPWGMAFNHRGEILVVERYGHCISIFSPTGEKLRSFGSEGSGPGQFNGPRGIAVDDDDNILVTDGDNVQKYSSKHKHLTNVGSKGSNSLEFHIPVSVAVSPTTKKIVVMDCLNHRAQILNPNLTYNSSIGSKGSGNGQLNKPYNAAFDSAGNMYVTDALNNRIQVFTPEGNYLRQFGKSGKGNGELNYPIGIYIDSDDTVYVVDHGNHRVSVFTCEGRFLTSFGSYGRGPGQFNSPRGIIMDKSGTIIVSDSDNNRLQMF